MFNMIFKYKQTCFELSPLVTSQLVSSEELDPLTSCSPSLVCSFLRLSSSSPSKQRSRDLLLSFLCQGSKDFRRLSSALLSDFFN